MLTPEPLPNEDERLAELFRYEILDSPPEPDFDEIVELAAELCEAEISLVSLVDDRRQWFKASYGLDAKETPKNIAFCAHAIHTDDIFEIPNAIEDERFHDNPLVTNEPHIRFYAGQPLYSANGYKFGTLCVIDRHPRELTAKQRQILSVLARQVERQLELRLRVKQLQESLKIIHEQKKLLVNLNQIKDNTLSVLCHDLRNPLNGLESILDLFDHDALEPPEIVKLIQDIKPDIQQCSQQLNQVLNWVQVQSQGQDVHCENFLLNPVAEKSLAWVAKNAETKGVKLIRQIEPGLTIFGNQELLEIVWRNLLSNAVKYTRKGDKIILFAYKQEHGICLGVRDTGLGIKEEDIEKVLSSDVQFSTLGTTREKGTGLGLMLCQTYLQRMNSELKVKSRWMEGSEFYFLLPSDLV